MGLGGFEEADLVTREVTVSGRTMRVRMPGRPEALLEAIDPVEFQEDERMPYWAELWPSAIGLARHLLERAAATVAGEDVLELGAGLGLGGIAAALAGARSVVFTDYFEESLAFAAENARRNGVARFETRLVDWRAPDLGRRFRAVVGSDLLYEARNSEPVARALAALLAPDGLAWIADPGRTTAAGFEDHLRAAGLAVAREPAIRVEKTTVSILGIRRK